MVGSHRGIKVEGGRERRTNPELKELYFEADMEN